MHGGGSDGGEPERKIRKYPVREKKKSSGTCIRKGTLGRWKEGSQLLYNSRISQGAQWDEQKGVTIQLSRSSRPNTGVTEQRLTRMKTYFVGGGGRNLPENLGGLKV